MIQYSHHDHDHCGVNLEFIEKFTTLMIKYYDFIIKVVIAQINMQQKLKLSETIDSSTLELMYDETLVNFNTKLYLRFLKYVQIHSHTHIQTNLHISIFWSMDLMKTLGCSVQVSCS